MAASVIQVEYDRLAEVANGFGRNGETAAALQGQVLRSAQQLRQGGWEGRGSAAFFSAINTTTTRQSINLVNHEQPKIVSQGTCDGPDQMVVGPAYHHWKRAGRLHLVTGLWTSGDTNYGGTHLYISRIYQGRHSKSLGKWRVYRRRSNITRTLCGRRWP
ncbi:MAG: WXG100 family type VII secretion target [Anaerolinea sp.]|nr:WXG100 family type VII secretion target [Anaerolinea sp.]